MQLERPNRSINFDIRKTILVPLLQMEAQILFALLSVLSLKIPSSLSRVPNPG